MSDPSAVSQILGFLAFAALVATPYAVWALVRRTRNAHPEPVPTTGLGVPAPIPYHCATFGHYYKKVYADRWTCAECGHTVNVDGSPIVGGVA